LGYQAASAQDLELKESRAYFWPQTVICECRAGKYQPSTIIKPEAAKNGEIEALLDCLARLESGNNPLAYNPRDSDGLPAYGLLQFKDFTFKEKCVDGFGLLDDIWDGQNQRECAARLIALGEQWRWPPLKHCL